MATKIKSSPLVIFKFQLLQFPIYIHHQDSTNPIKQTKKTQQKLKKKLKRILFQNISQENMKTGMGLMLLTVFMAVMSSTRVSAQSSCTSALISMAPCLNYITGNTTSPSQQCCSQLRSVVQSSPDCLCQALNGGGSQLGLNINQTQALALPRACNVQTPPISRCNGKNFQKKITYEDCSKPNTGESYGVWLHLFAGGGSNADSPADSPKSSGKWL